MKFYALRAGGASLGKSAAAGKPVPGTGYGCYPRHMSWRSRAAITLMLAASGCGGVMAVGPRGLGDAGTDATASSDGGLADGGADTQAPEASADGRAGWADGGQDATPDATPLCGHVKCAAGELCHWDFASCGRPYGAPNATDSPGCQAPDAACNAQPPVCGCDGKVYASKCAAHAAGVDTWWEGCTAPAGYFKCGDKFCRLATEICHEDLGDTGDRWSSCEPRPACDTGTLCDCLDATDCNGAGPHCKNDGQGRVTEACWYP